MEIEEEKPKHLDISSGFEKKTRRSGSGECGHQNQAYASFLKAS